MRFDLKPYRLLSLFAGLMFLLVLLSGCDDIIEPSIKNSQVQLEAPTNQYTSTSYTVNFWWDAVDHALTYHLQVVTPNFAAPGGLVLDTTVTGNRFSFSFSPGVYQWRVMAENGSSQTGYAVPRTFTVEQSSLTNQSVQLSSPANGTTTGQSSVTFQWASLYSATGYRLEIDTNNFQNTSALVYNQVVPGQQVNFTFPKNQTYQWRVQAQNDTTTSQWSAVYSVTYNNTAPAQVTLISPTNSQVVTIPLQLQWNAVSSAAQYKLYVFQSDSTTTFNSSFPLFSTTTSYNFNFGSSGNRIYWKVSAISATGVEGPASTLRSFVLQ
jgi:hypothetical protein